MWEYFVNKSHRVVETRLHGNERYLGPLGANPSTGRGQETFQGGYHCSVRSVTEWEEPGAPHGKGRILDHPNYYSRYMDSKVEDDGKVPHRRAQWVLPFPKGKRGEEEKEK